MKAKRHDWSTGKTQFCRNAGCNWMRMSRMESGGAATTAFQYKRTDESVAWWRSKAKVPPCEGSKP